MANKNIFLRSNRLYFEPLEEKHLTPSYISWLNGSKTTQYNSHGVFPNTKQKTLRYIESIQNDSSTIVLAIIEQLTDTHIGNIAIQYIDFSNSTCEISIMIGDRNYWSHGYGYEAFHRIIQHCFNKLNLNKISIGTTSDNISMQNVAKKLGMTQEGTRRSEIKRDSQYFDIYLYGLLKDEYKIPKQKIVASIEARMTSSRLPGKVLKLINNIPALELMVKRVLRAEKLDEVIIATTTNEEDAPIIKWCEQNKIKYFRGSEENVYERVLNTHITNNTDIIVELTGDCPLLDPVLIDEAIECYLNNKYEYVSNCIEESYPLGMAVEVFSLEALKTIADNRELSIIDKEHVSPFFYTSNQYKIFNITAPNNLTFPELSVTLDTQEDFVVIEKIDQCFDNNNYTIKDIINIAKKNPKWISINTNIHRKGLE
ncbi:MAG: GNAT family N-acetyltransferase [Arcobacteraceae bacterium]|nr:GNAT family N-acetyltransferase [Arcobacteraceae bacterium]